MTQGEVTSLRSEREHLIANEAKTTKALEQRLQHAVDELENVRKEHQASLLRLHGDNQLMASLHRVNFDLFDTNERKLKYPVPSLQEQVDRLKERHSEELQSLQGQIDLASSEIQRLQKVANSVHRSLSPQVKGTRKLFKLIQVKSCEHCRCFRR